MKINNRTTKLVCNFNNYLNNRHSLKNIFTYISVNNYSILLNKSNEQSLLIENYSKNKFFEWFSGFTDAEGNFYIVTSKSYSFRFRINLHKDDVKMLQYIQESLGFGEVKLYNNFASFIVTRIKDISQLINIFDKYQLQGTKLLDYKDFTTAFKLYTEVDNKDEVFLKIKDIKNNMNSLRFDFTMPKDKIINITPYWLLGFIEGDGSFSINKNNQYRLDFSMSQSFTNKYLMENIKNFLENLPNTNNNYKGAIGISEIKNNKFNQKSTIRIETARKSYLINVFIPFLENLTWQSKKYLDFIDWVNILKLKEKGHHFSSHAKKAVTDKNIKSLKSIRLLLSKPFSTLTKNVISSDSSLCNIDSQNFCEWFIGFSDAEGSFDFIRRKSRNAYYFRFRISLHIDDEGVLNIIKNKLGIGRVSTYGKTSIFIVDKISEVQVIINIFNNRSLNSSKYLNFLNFKEAYSIYTTSEFNEELCIKLENLRSGMNRKRTDFNLPNNHKVKITPNWLLGFIEGDGSFNVALKGFALSFSLSQSSVDFILLENISYYLNDLAKSKDIKYSNKYINVYKGRDPLGKSRGDCQLTITSSEFLRDILIPFFDNMTFYSKKYKDYKDWKAILNLKDLGLHYTDKGLDLINKILNQINNNRLSSSNLPEINRNELELEINKNLEDGNSNYEFKEGKIWIKSLNRFQSKFKNEIVELLDIKDNVLNTFSSISECSRILNINKSTLNYRIKKNLSFEYNGKLVYLRKKINFIFI